MRTIITKQKMDHAVSVLNRTMGTTIGDEFFLQGAYGGWQLMRKIPGTTAADSITTGFVPKRELFNIICGMSTALALYQDKQDKQAREENILSNA